MRRESCSLSRFAPTLHIWRNALGDDGGGECRSRDYTVPMDLYTCPARTHGANAPLYKHPCGVAAKALDEAGHTYTVKIAGGFKKVPFSRRGKRKEILELTGQEDVPVLVLDDGDTVTGTAAIVEWATAHSAATA